MTDRPTEGAVLADEIHVLRSPVVVRIYGPAASSPSDLPPRSAPAPLGCADEPEHDAEPIPETKRARESIGALQRCRHCDHAIGSPHWRKRYCSGRCRVAAHRARHGGGGGEG